MLPSSFLAITLFELADTAAAGPLTTPRSWEAEDGGVKTETLISTILGIACRVQAWLLTLSDSIASMMALCVCVRFVGVEHAWLSFSLFYVMFFSSAACCYVVIDKVVSWIESGLSHMLRTGRER